MRLGAALLTLALAVPAKAEETSLFALPGLFEQARRGNAEAEAAVRAFRRAAPVEPAIVSGGTAPVTEANTGWDPGAGLLVPQYRFAPIQARRPLTDGRKAPLWQNLQRLVARGKAAGLAGVLYDNRDAGHSTLRPGDWPQLAFTEYGRAVHAAGLARGVNSAFRFDAPVIGNASVAMTGGIWRSMPRLAMTMPDGAARMFQLYAANHLYVFPEHRDHDPDHGDMLPANQPYALISQGSSGSDRPFLEALLAIVAALPPEARAKAEAEDLLAPTVQAIFRRGLAGAADAAAYMSPVAHPTVFPSERIDLERMIALAQATRADTLAPMVWLSVIGEDVPEGPPDGLAEGPGEALFTTPSAIARVWRGGAAERRMVVSAALTKDPNGRDLTFHWRVVRGDPARIRIEPRDKAGRIVEIAVPWQERAPVEGTPAITSQRVDIAVFADNGAALSAPAFLSWTFPPDQAREYAEVAGATRLVSVDHRADTRTRRRTDPLVFGRRDWRDDYAYDEAGRLTGWTRTRTDTSAHYTADGLRVVETDAMGRPVRAEAVAYGVTAAGGEARIEETGTGRFTVWDYAGPDDRTGTMRPE